jgi:hypothetical protein
VIEHTGVGKIVGPLAHLFLLQRQPLADQARVGIALGQSIEGVHNFGSVKHCKQAHDCVGRVVGAGRNIFCQDTAGIDDGVENDILIWVVHDTPNSTRSKDSKSATARFVPRKPRRCRSGVDKPAAAIRRESRPERTRIKAFSILPRPVPLASFLRPGLSIPRRQSQRLKPHFRF